MRALRPAHVSVRGIVVASLLCAGSATRVWAIVTTSGCSSASSCTLAELFAGGTIQVNATRFADWELEFVDPDGVQPSYASIVVEGRDDGGLTPGDGIRFSSNSELGVSGSARLDLAIGFTVTSVASNREIQGSSLMILSDSAVGSAFLQVGEFVANPSGVGLGQTQVITDPAFAPPAASDAIEFPDQSGLIVEKDILIQSGAAGDSAELDTFEQRYALPEPEGSAPLAAGALVLSALRQRRARCSAENRRQASTRGGH